MTAPKPLKPLPHDAARLHVTGAARYVDDIPTPADCLHLAFGLSPIAKGRLVSLDLDAVRSAPGVVCVLRAEDLPGDCDCAPVVADEPLLSDGNLHFLGQPVFLVAATSHRAARVAARRAVMETEAEEPCLDPEQALAAQDRFEEAPRIWARGDPEGAIAEAPHQLEGRLVMGGQEHFYLEGQACLALPQEGGDMVIHASTQHPSEIQHKVAHALGLPLHGVRVETRRMGGGFGGKESQGNALAIACAVIARLTGRPAKMRYDRDDDFMITGKRHGFVIDYCLGHDAEGRILGIDMRQITPAGWSQDLTLAVADRAMLTADNAYFLPHVRIESHRLRTNIQSATAYRGFGGPQGMLGMERVLDHLAHAVGRDPLAVRRLNYYTDMDPSGAGGSAPTGPEAPPPRSIETKKTTKAVQTTPYGQKVEDFILGSMTDALCASAEYSARRLAVEAWNAENPVLKKGLAVVPVKFGISFTLTFLNQAGALVHVYSDGSVMMNHGGTEMGQGLFQKVAQVAAATLGVPLEAVKITATDTAKVPNTSATAASSGSDLNGMAVQIACQTIRERMAAHLAEAAGLDPKEVRFSDGLVRVGAEKISFAEAAQRCYQARVGLSATGFYKTPDLSWDRIKGEGRPFFYFAYGVSCTEVVVDSLTGEYRILRADILHDCGTSLNPALDKGQIEGGYVQGAGWLTTEELVWDAKGALRTHAPSTYKIPACSDRPEVFNVDLWEGANPAATVFRSKAVGEPPFLHGVSAFLALSDAVSAYGPSYPALDAPATPEQVLAAIQRVQA